MPGNMTIHFATSDTAFNELAAVAALPEHGAVVSWSSGIVKWWQIVKLVKHCFHYFTVLMGDRSGADLISRLFWAGATASACVVSPFQAGIRPLIIETERYLAIGQYRCADGYVRVGFSAGANAASGQGAGCVPDVLFERTKIICGLRGSAVFSEKKCIFNIL